MNPQEPLTVDLTLLFLAVYQTDPDGTCELFPVWKEGRTKGRIGKSILRGSSRDNLNELLDEFTKARQSETWVYSTVDVEKGEIAKCESPEGQIVPLKKRGRRHGNDIL
jgi:hypothetical protein